jgi:hypothetical protein
MGKMMGLNRGAEQKMGGDKEDEKGEKCQLIRRMGRATNDQKGVDFKRLHAPPLQKIGPSISKTLAIRK